MSKIKSSATVTGRFSASKPNQAGALKTATVEPTFDTWSPDDVILASLALGELRSAIDAVKAASDKLHRARRCPDHLLVAQMLMLDQDIPHVLVCAKELQTVYHDVCIKMGRR